MRTLLLILLVIALEISLLKIQAVATKPSIAQKPASTHAPIIPSPVVPTALDQKIHVLEQQIEKFSKEQETFKKTITDQTTNLNNEIKSLQVRIAQAEQALRITPPPAPKKK